LRSSHLHGADRSDEAVGAPDREVAFAVPTGNFGNVLAAWAARRMGLPVARLVIGSNRNDILSRFLAGNDMSIRGVEPSLSPSMDIQVSSNFERLLFELLDRDAAATARVMAGFRAEGRMAVPEAAWRRAGAVFHGFALDDDGTLAEIRRLHAACDYLADPHSAIGIAAARTHMPAHGIPMVAMATAPFIGLGLQAVTSCDSFFNRDGCSSRGVGDAVF
jgi:threonine synthase